MTLGGIAVVLAIVVAVVLIGRGGGEDDGGGSPSASGNDQLSKPEPGSVVSEGESASVEMETSEGSFTIELDTENWPVTANSFAYLTEEGFFDGLGFHRIVTDFVIQGGDPTGSGTGGPGYSVVEKPPADTTYPVGTVAMAKTATEAPGTSGSQFYVVTGTSSPFEPVYAIVGQVSEGLDVVEKIGKLGDPAGIPTEEVVIEKATLEKG